MDLPDNNAWMLPLNINSNFGPPQQLPAPGFSPACTELFARRPEIFDVPPSSATIPMMPPPPDMDAFRNNFMLFQPQPEPPGLNAWMCGGGSGGGGSGSLMGSGLMGSGGGMAAMMMPDDENENIYFAQNGNGGGGGIGPADLGAGDITAGMVDGCSAGWMMGRPTATPSNWGSGGGSSGGGIGINGGGVGGIGVGGFGFSGGVPEPSSFNPAAMAGLGLLMGHRNLLPDI